MNQPTLYEQIMGPGFARLPRAVQRFHSLSGRWLLDGWVDTHAPTNALARWLARRLGAPQRSASGPIRFELDAHPDAEQWTRHFPSQTMRSRLSRTGDFMEEQLGASTLRFRLHATDDGLSMELHSLRFMGVPCPRWLLPTVVAQEHGDGDTFHFIVRAALPLLGVVASYQGHLVLQPEGHP